MPISKKVRDLVVPLSDYAVTNVDSTLSDAAMALMKVYCQIETGKCTEAGHRNILILNKSGELVGILDFKSILKILIPEITGGFATKLEAMGVSIAFAQADAPELDESRISFRARVLKNAECRVGDIMRPLRGRIDADADLLDALKMICNTRITVLPVFENKKLIGVLRDSDVFLSVVDILREDYVLD